MVNWLFVGWGRNCELRGMWFLWGDVIRLVISVWWLGGVDVRK